MKITFSAKNAPTAQPAAIQSISVIILSLIVVLLGFS